MIQVIALIVITLSLLVLAYRRPTLGFSMLGLLVLIAIGGYFLTKDRVAAPDSRFDSSDVSLVNPSVEKGYANSDVLRAEVVNHHAELAVDEITIRSTRYYCEQLTTPLTACTTLSSHDSLVKIYVLPEQSKLVSVSLRDSKPKKLAGQIRWDHEILRVR